MTEPRVGQVAAPGRLATAAANPARAATVALAGLVVLAMSVRLWLAGWISTPWIMADEFVYSELAKSLASTGEFTLREGTRPFLSIAYPALISPAWLLEPMSTTYAVAKAINVLLMTAAVVPLYLWSRQLVSPAHGLLAAGLTLVMPSFVYTAMLMTENAFLPSFVLAAWAFARTLERPTAVRQALAFGAIVLASSVRLQALVLAAVLPTAILLNTLFELRDAPRARPLQFAFARLRRFWLTALLLAGTPALYVLLQVVRGHPLSSTLGAYAEVVRADYSFAQIRHWLLLHAAELPISVGIVPACALLVLLGLALTRGGARSPAERAFLAVTASATVWIVAEVAVFASRFSFRVQERYMFVLAPLLFLALALWLDRGLPRPRLISAIAAAVPAALALALPLQDLLNISILSDTFALIPFLRLSQLVPGGVRTTQLLLVAGAVAGGLLFLLWPRRRFAHALLPAAVGAFLLISTYPVLGAARDYAQALRDYAGTAAGPSWIDERLGADGEAAFLIGSTHQPDAEKSVLWQTEFWNRSVGDVYALIPGASQFEETHVRIAGEGLLVDVGDAAVHPSHVVASQDLELAGELLLERPPLALYRLDGPLRVAAATAGVYADGWMGAEASYSRYGADSRSGRVAVSLSRAAWGGPDTPARVEIVLAAGGESSVVRRSTIRAGASRAFDVPVPSGPFTLAVRIEPTFSPADFGLADTRQLGAQVAFSYEPTDEPGG